MHSTQVATAQDMQNQGGSLIAPDPGNFSVITALAGLNSQLSSVLGSISTASYDKKDFQLEEYEVAVSKIRRLTELMHIGATALQSGEVIVSENEQACHLNDHNAGAFNGKCSAIPGEKKPIIPGDHLLSSPQTPEDGPNTGQVAEDQVGDEGILPETGNRDLLLTISDEISTKYACLVKYLVAQPLTDPLLVPLNGTPKSLN